MRVVSLYYGGVYVCVCVYFLFFLFSFILFLSVYLVMRI